MIQITYKAVPGKPHKLALRGHAGYAQHGNDIVCAGVSAITFTLVGFLKNHEDVSWRLQTHYESGNCEISCGSNTLTDTAFDMAIIGYAQMAKKYPDYIQLSAIGGDTRK